jgi:peptide/nickel transport system substrate-binding protein
MAKQPFNLLNLSTATVLTAFLLLGCSHSDEKALDRQVFRYNEHKNISSLDPAFAKDNANIWAVHQLFNGLVQLDENMKIKPCIASQWEISENGTLYTFYLRPDIYFHAHEKFGPTKTRLVTAADFEFSFKRLLDPKLASPGGWVLSAVDDFFAKDNHTFQIKLKHPFPAFLGLLSMKYCSVVPKEIIEYYGTDFRSHPIGTGPFFLKRWSENNKLVFRNNQRYFEIDSAGNKLPYLEAIAITFLADKQSEYSQFIQGNLDFISGLDAAYKDDILTPKGKLQAKYKPRINMLKSPYLNTEYLGFYMDSDIPEVQSRLLRQAFNYGFDRNKMITYLRNNIGSPANGGFIPRGLPGFEPTIGFDFNPEKAKALVNEYKRLTNNPNPTLKLSTTENYLSFCEFIQRALLDIGLNISIDVMPASALKSAKANGKTALFRASWVADYPDAQNYLSLFYSKNFAPNGPNYTHFKNEEFDRIYEGAMIETNDSLRIELYKKMDAIVMKEAPITVLFYDEVVRFTQKNINGLGINPTNLLELKKVRKN